MLGGRGDPTSDKRTNRPSRQAVLKFMGKLKREDYERHQQSCARSADDAYDWSSVRSEDFDGFGRVPPVDLGRLTASRALVTTDTALERVEERQPSARLDQLPKHIEPFGRYMALAAAEPMTPRRLVKAFVVTRSSVQRQGVPKKTVCKVYPEYTPLPRHSDPGIVRPEDVMARLLFSPAGARYLDAAEGGRFDDAAARELANRMQCFGLIDNPQGLYADMRYAATKVSTRALAIAEALKAAPDQYWAFVKKNLKGIGPSKAGFFAALLGRGDIPTFDAREKGSALRPAFSFVHAPSLVRVCQARSTSSATRG